ncbi:MAG: tol-pal system protein YbgF [Halieaceae bacterium]|jgi:tol-pal system protein YbgF|nr:tol-pal system protein YbgF [Halieaceae bacterium]
MSNLTPEINGTMTRGETGVRSADKPAALQHGRRHASVVLALLLHAAVAVPALGQEYIDLEAEQRAREAAEATGQIDEATMPPGPAAVEPGDAAGSAGELFYQMQLLQQEVMELRGRLEEQEYQLKQLREQSLERYLDLDQRLKGGAGATAGEGGEAAAVAPAPQGQSLAGEEEAYRAAYGLVRSQQFEQAITAFRQFLVDFPGGRYTPNAHYWLGELYLVQVPADDESARREFTLLLERFPNHNKVPDALYKLGKIYYDRGNRDRARAYLTQVVEEFGNSGSSAVQLAQDFLSSNFQDS